jgi:type I restriction enzyme M protein
VRGAPPGQLLFTTQIPVCLWFLARNKSRRLHTLFIDARKLGRLTGRVHRELTEEDASQIVGTYHARRGDPGAEQLYADAPGFCKSTSVVEIGQNGFVLTPGRYVGTEDIDEEVEPFEERLNRLVTTLDKQFIEGDRLGGVIRSKLRGLGYGGPVSGLNALLVT